MRRVSFTAFHFDTRCLMSTRNCQQKYLPSCQPSGFYDMTLPSWVMLLRDGDPIAVRHLRPASAGQRFVVERRHGAAVFATRRADISSMWASLLELAMAYSPASCGQQDGKFGMPRRDSADQAGRLKSRCWRIVSAIACRPYMPNHSFMTATSLAHAWCTFH